MLPLATEIQCGARLEAGPLGQFLDMQESTGAGALPGQHPETQVLPHGGVNNPSLQGLLRRGLSTERG